MVCLLEEIDAGITKVSVEDNPIEMEVKGKE